MQKSNYKEEFLKNFMKEMYGDTKIEPIEIEESERLNPYYCECIILESGKILELKGSHEMTAAQYFDINMEEIPMEVYGINYWLKNYKVIFVNGRDIICAEEINSDQAKTLKKLIDKNIIDKDYRIIKG